MTPHLTMRAIVDPNGIGCAEHGQHAWGLCAPCTLKMLHDLGAAGDAPVLAHEARRVFGGLAALLEANPAAGKFGVGSRDASLDTHTIPNADLSRAALALSTAAARVEEADDPTGELRVAHAELARAIDALGLVVGGTLDAGRRRLAEERPPQTPPSSTPVGPPPTDRRFEDAWHAAQGKPRWWHRWRRRR